MFSQLIADRVARHVSPDGRALMGSTEMEVLRSGLYPVAIDPASVRRDPIAVELGRCMRS